MAVAPVVLKRFVADAVQGHTITILVTIWLKNRGAFITGGGVNLVNDLDRNLLKFLQNNFPITPEPFKDLALYFEVTEEEILERVRKLKEKGIIRRIGGVCDSRKLGYKSTLCAMSVPQERLQETTEIVNSYLGVTHNYLREHHLNMWFTLIAPSQKKLEQIIFEITTKTGLPVKSLPASRIFKIKVEFEIPEGEDNFVG